MGLLRSLVRLLVVWFADAVSLLVTAWILPGINFVQVDNIPAFAIASAAALRTPRLGSMGYATSVSREQPPLVIFPPGNFQEIITAKEAGINE